MGTTQASPFLQSYAFQNYKIIDFEIDEEDLKEDVRRSLTKTLKQKNVEEDLKVEKAEVALRKECLKLHILIS